MVVIRSLGIKLLLDLLYTQPDQGKYLTYFAFDLHFFFILIFQAGDKVGGK